MKRALAERAAKQSSLPNKGTKKPSVAVVAAHSLQQQQQHHQLHPASSSVVQSPSSPELHPPPMKIPRLQHNNQTTSSAPSSQQTDGARGGAGAAGPFPSSSVSSTALPSSSSSSLPVNHHHHHMHHPSSAAATGGGGESTDAVSSGARRGSTSQHNDHHHKQAEPPSTAAAAGAASTKNKRQRNAIENHSNSHNGHREDQAEEEEEEDEETKASGFYLKHQNRALATELSSLQASVAELTAEREYRRRTCLEAVQALHSLQATWTSLEAAFGQQQHHAPTSASPASQHHDARTPSSTAGSTPETSVEWTVALHDALQALGSSSSNSSQNQPDGKGGIVADNGDTSHLKNRHAPPQPPPPCPPPDPAVADLGRIAANVSSRANCLQEWIWNLLQLTPEERRRMGSNVQNDGDATMKNNGDDDDDDTAENQDSTAQRKNAIYNTDTNAPLYWKHSCQRLETQVLELTQSRNQIAQRERKLRRNMYRLSAGMMTQQQVLQQAIHSPDGTTDEHEEFLAATAMATAAAAAASANHGTTTTTTDVAANGLGGNNNNNNINNNSLDHSDHRGNSNGNSDVFSPSLPIKEEQGPGYGVGGIQMESSSMLPQHDGSSSSMEQVGSSTTGVATALVALASGSAGGDVSGGKFMPFAAIDEMKHQLQTARQQVMQGENTIQELNATLQERELRINHLITKQQSEEDVQRLILLEATTCKLDVANQKVAELQEKLSRLKTEWAQSAGNDQTLRESMKEMQDKHHKRWSELTTNWSATSNAEGQVSAAGDDNNSESSNGGAATGEASTADAEEGLATAVSTTSAAEAAALGAESQERKIMELQHKLSQALENVRQAETARNNLKTALSMNTTLQGKLDDLKHKYAAAFAAAAEQRSNSSSSNANPNANSSSSRSNNHTSSTDVSSAPSGAVGGGSSTPRERDSSSSTAAAATSASGSGSTHTNQERADKLYRDNKRMKKEIATIMASKEAHKAKIERVEKERDGLMDANARLLKQVTENDEMNAKSLSTILHLKSMTDHLKTERDNLEQQVKSASQLALASRLASNAKDRVSEEMLKEKNAIHEHLTELETTHAATKDELNRITLEWSQADGKTASIRSELGNALQRCDELVAQIEEKREEIRKLVAALDIAEQEARDAKNKLAESAAAAAADNKNSTQRRMSGGGAGTGDSSTSNFTVEQLNTQISFLKGRLACPVCHYRDKQCIIMRCRHMHCKQCVDEQISNRSRKCPSCNGKFSEKDVEDVWLD